MHQHSRARRPADRSLHQSAGRCGSLDIALNSCRGGDIVNSNGQLACNSNGYNNGRRHHRDGDDRDNNGGYHNGGYHNGGNNNGAYNNGGYNNGRYGNRGAVGGSYQSSCTNVYVNGGTLTASCTSPNGQRITSSINPAQCRGGDIANVNGRLACR